MKIFGFSVPSSLVTGVATGIAQMAGGPVAGMIVGGAVGGLTAVLDGKTDFNSIAKDALLGVVGGAIPGGIAGGTARNAFFTSGVRSLGRSFRDIPALLGPVRIIERQVGPISSFGESMAARSMVGTQWMVHRGLGAIVAGAGAMGVRAFDDSVNSVGEPAMTRIPTKPVPYSSNMPPELTEVERPDNDEMKRQSYPDRYRMNDDFFEKYKDFVPQIFETPYKTAGQGLKTVPPISPIPRFKPDDKALKAWGETFSSYQDVVEAMNKSLEKLVVNENAVLPLLQKAAPIVDEFKEKLRIAVGDLNESARRAPAQGVIEDNWVMSYITESSDAVTKCISDAQYELRAAAEGLNSDAAPTTSSSTPDSAIQQILDNQKELKEKQDAQDAALAELTRQRIQANDQQNNGTDQNGDNFDDLFGKNKSVEDTTDTKGTQPDLTDQTGTGSNPTTTGGNPTGAGSNPAPVNESSIPANSGVGGGSGFDPSSLLMSMLPSMLMNRNNDDYGNRYNGIDPERYDRNQQPLLPIQANPAVNTPQAPSAAPVAANTNTPAQAAPANNTPAAAPPPARVPGPNEGVDFTFPDGVTQRVSYTVKLALDAALGNHAGTDAQAAYAQTGAKWADSKQIGKRVDPNEVMTGDVATWSDLERTAIVRKIGSGMDATIDVIIAGGLLPLHDVLSGGSAVFEGGDSKGRAGGKGAIGAPALPQAPDGSGVSVLPTGTPTQSDDSGAADSNATTFAGFAHPRGIEVSNVSAKDSGGGVPAGGDPAAGAPVDAPAVPVS